MHFKVGLEKPGLYTGSFNFIGMQTINCLFVGGNRWDPCSVISGFLAVVRLCRVSLVHTQPRAQSRIWEWFWPDLGALFLWDFLLSYQRKERIYTYTLSLTQIFSNFDCLEFYHGISRSQICSFLLEFRLLCTVELRLLIWGKALEI